jgi:hypothetical protein
MKRAEDWTPLTKNHLGTVTSAKPGSIRSTCGMIDAKYGTRTIAAAEKSRVPPGRSARRFHIRYVVVVLPCGPTLLLSKNAADCPWPEIWMRPHI